MYLLQRRTIYFNGHAFTDTYHFAGMQLQGRAAGTKGFNSGQNIGMICRQVVKQGKMRLQKIAFGWKVLLPQIVEISLCPGLKCKGKN